MSIQLATNELHKAFKLLNKHFFDGELVEPAITIQSGGKRLSMGWCTSDEVWNDNEGNIKKYEINIGAEYLNIDVMETMDTLLHEMIHLFCATNNIKDTSRTGTYHNKNFKNECLKRGFYFSDDKPHKTYGWAFPKITDETKELIKTFDINEEAFLIARKPPGVANEEESGQEKSESTGRKKSFKWICPGCTLIIRSTKEDINVMCGDCKEHLILCE